MAARSLVLRFGVREIPAAILRWITAHPGQGAFLVTQSVVIFTPAALTGPLLATMSFGVLGPGAGSVAAWLQSILGNVGAQSMFAYLQSAAMGGYGVAAVNGITQAFVAMSSAVTTTLLWRRQ